MMEPQYKLEEDGYFIEKDATFSISDFMRDLEWFYQAMRMHFAFEQMCRDNDEPALALHEDGRYFAGLPFFEQYRHDREDDPEIDYSPAGGDLLKEMQMDAIVAKERDTHEGFALVPFDYYEEPQEKLVDMLPDFRIRLKVNPKTRKMVFAADVYDNENEGVVMSCPFCGEAFVRRNNRAVICGKTECYNARKAMNQRNSRKMKKIAAQQSK